MNFKGPADFKYVSGELSEIEIDNDIMPVRSPDASHRLRGIDIAFLMEAVEERARLIGLEGKTFTFSKKITLQQVNEIIARYNEIVDTQTANTARPFTADTAFFVKEYGNASVHFRKPFTCGSTEEWTDFNDVFKADLSKVGILSEDKILYETVSSLYGEVGKLVTQKKGAIEPTCSEFSAKWTYRNPSFAGIDYIYESCTRNCFIRKDSVVYPTATILKGRAEAVSGVVRIIAPQNQDGLEEASWCLAYVRSGISGTNGRVVALALTKPGDSSASYELPFDDLKTLATTAEEEDSPVSTSLFTESASPCYDLSSRTRWDISE